MWQSLMELDSNILFYVQDNLRNDALNDIVEIGRASCRERV